MFKLILLISFTVVTINGFVRPTYDIRLKESRIVGGEDAPEGGIPYQVSLRSIFNSHFCGGSILNERWILTAAHCTIGSSASSIKVIVGTNSLVAGGDRYNVQKVIVHEGYDGNLIKNDVSLLRLSKDILYSEKVQPIDLPEENTESGASLLLSGWGRVSYPGSLPTQLQMINLTALGVTECQRVFLNINPVYDTQICSLPKSGEGACHGDSGGPLVENDNIVGIVSWGMPCARGYPDVYTRVYAFKDWILARISEVEFENTENSEGSQ